MTTVPLFFLVVYCAIAKPMPAQVALHEGQGHPWKGVWLGDWGTGKTNRNQVVVEMDWDGKAITGSINPGLFFKVRHSPALRIRFGRGWRG